MLRIDKKETPRWFVEAQTQAMMTYRESHAQTGDASGSDTSSKSIQHSGKGNDTPYECLESSTRKKLKDALLEEQGHLCAYCMSGINAEHMKIEHYYPRHDNGDGEVPSEKSIRLSVSYGNMLAVCRGEGNGKSETTCDTHRGNTPLTVDPRRQGDIDTIRYLSDGTIDSTDDAIKHDLQDVLNLNVRRLKRNRMAAWMTVVRQRAVKGRNGKILLTDNTRQTLLNMYEKQREKKTPYAGFIMYQLRHGRRH